MFSSFFRLNPNLWAYDVQGIDNRHEGLGLPVLYNRIIRTHLAEDCWLFLVHEDLEIKGYLASWLTLDKRAVYGTFGVRMEGDEPVAHGLHTCSHKDGSRPARIGQPVEGVQSVQTLDCQSVLVHTDLLRTYNGLRFDENLTFDLYAEDFCMQAQFNHGLPIYVVGSDNQHYSYGRVTERYRQGLAYLARKYPDRAVPGTCSFIGGESDRLARHFTYDTVASASE